MKECFPLKVLLFLVLTFFFIPLLVHSQQLYDDLFSLSFPTEKDGWASGRWGCILHTQDGGKTWVRENTNTDYTLSSIFFLDANNGWAVGDGGTILHSTDGGKTWEKQKSPVDFFLMDVCFVSPLKGFIVSERTHILSTEDGGETWKVQFTDQDFILKAITFSDSFNGWAVGEYGFIYHTSDGGTTWVKQSGYFTISDLTGDIEGANYLFAAEALDAQRVWAVGVDGYVLKTEDGGKTWQEVSGMPKTHLFGVSSDKKSTILICGNGTFILSADGGKTWDTSEFKPPITYNWLYKAKYIPSSGFITVGSEGAIYCGASNIYNRVKY
jgi:photosystem II stability/assembly factor-like uncharacterized protein